MDKKKTTLKQPTPLKKLKDTAKRKEKENTAYWEKLLSPLSDEEKTALAEASKDFPMMEGIYHHVNRQWLIKKSELDDDLMKLLLVPDAYKLDRYAKNIEAFNRDFAEEESPNGSYPYGEVKLMFARAAVKQTETGGENGRGQKEEDENLRKVVRQEAKANKNDWRDHAFAVRQISEMLQRISDPQNEKGKASRERLKDKYGSLPKNCKRGNDWISKNIRDILPPRGKKKNT